MRSSPAEHYSASLLPLRSATAALLCTVLLGPNAVRASGADGCPSQLTGKTLARHAADERAAELRQLIYRQRSNHNLWQTAWVGSLGTLVAAQAILAGQSEADEKRASYAIGAFKSFMGMTSVALARNGAEHLETVMTGEPCADLALAETQVTALADSQRRGTALWKHIAGVIMNTAGSLLLGFLWDDWQGAGIGLVTGIAVNQGFMRTHPTGALDLVDEAPGQVVDGKATVTLRPTFGPAGIGLLLTF